MATKIVITSGKGGVGKTTITASLGIALALLKQKVLLIDFDVNLNNLDVALNVENKVVYDLMDVLQEKCRPKQAIIQDYELENLYVLASCNFFNANRFEINKISSVINELSRDFDYILIDCPAGIGTFFNLAIKNSNEAIVVVTPHLTSIRDADKVLGLLYENNIANVRLVINRIRGDLVATKKMLSHKDICEMLHVELLGVVPEKDEMNIYTSYSFFRNIDGKSFRPYLIIANNILKNQKVCFDYLSKYKGVWGVIKRNIKCKI